MYLLYVDESGQPGGKRDAYYVVGGVAVHEQDCYPLASALEALVAKSLPARWRDLELHASEMWAGRRDWAPVPRKDRLRLVRSVFDLLGQWKAPSGRVPKYFAVAVHKPSFPSRVITRAHEELFSRFDEFLTRLHRAGQSHRSIVIADESSYEALLQTLVPQWKRVGARTGKLHSFADVPLYADSKASRLIQVADFVAWAVGHFYERGHTEWMQRLNHRFDADGGIQHGMAHLVRGYRSCPCVACHSRANGQVKKELVQLAHHRGQASGAAPTAGASPS